jgi:hypothetical protein
MKPQRRHLDTIVSRIMVAHRVLLIAGTAMLAVATSRLAQDASDEGSWILAVGASIVMYAADVIGTLELASDELRRSTSGQLSMKPDATRMDVFRYRAPRMTLQALFIGFALVALGLVWPKLW